MCDLLNLLTPMGRAARKRGNEGRRQNHSVFTYGNRVRSCLKIAQLHTVLRKCTMDRREGRNSCYLALDASLTRCSPKIIPSDRHFGIRCIATNPLRVALVLQILRLKSYINWCHPTPYKHST